MIKNIPNKYTREMLIELFDKTHKKKYDFLYLPIDPDVSIFSFRIHAIQAMPSSTSFKVLILKSFINNLTEKSGKDLIVKKSVD